MTDMYWRPGDQVTVHWINGRKGVITAVYRDLGKACVRLDATLNAPGTTVYVLLSDLHRWPPASPGR